MAIGSANFDWRAIRPLNGSRANGFEEMCAQLARRACPPTWRFERKGTSDAGVECYAALPNGSDWGWQAKYFDIIGTSQWKQLDESVKVALEKHPQLVKYTVCVPRDRSDARVNGQKSERQRWGDRVDKWTKWAIMRGMAVEFVWSGSSELIEQLHGNPGLVRFWFEASVFDSPWFSARLDEAIKTAGPRYTPEIHVDLPIAAKFEAFGRTPGFFREVKAIAKGIRNKLRTLSYVKWETPAPISDSAMSTLGSTVEGILTEIGAFRPQPSGHLPFRLIAEHLKSAAASVEEIATLVSQKEREDYKQRAEAENKSTDAYRHNPFREQRQRLEALESELLEGRKLILRAESLANNSVMILTGPAGTGKTRLLCDVAKHRLESSWPTVV